MRHRDSRLRTVEQSACDTIPEISRIASQQSCRHEDVKIDDGPSIMGTHVDDLGASEELRQAQLVERIPGATTRIRGLLDALKEKRGEPAESKLAPWQPPRGTSFTRRLTGPRMTSIEADTARRRLRDGQGPGSRA